MPAIPVDVRRLPWVRRFAADYAYRFAEMKPFFAGDPSSPAAWKETIGRVEKHDRRRAEIASILAAQQTARRAPARAMDEARRLADPRTLAVLTGQQAGLFGGPLYTLLKALTAIKLAEQVSRDHGVPVVAVFWVDSEDHDWEEVRSCTVLDDQPAPHRIQLPEHGNERASVASVCLDASIVAAIDELERVLPPTEFRARLTLQLRDAYAPGIGMADAFARWMEQVLGERGLIVFNAADQAAKPLARGVFARELSLPGETSRLAALAGADLASRGYHAQVQPLEHGPALFYLDGERRAIRTRDGRLLVGDTEYAAATLAQQAAEQPARFGPNVLLRPIVQDTLFPTVCYVSGPSELAYLGQLRGVYEHFDVPMPLVYPRATATLLDSAAVRFLTKHALPLEALQPQDESSLNSLLASEIPPVVERAFAEAVRSTDDVMTRLVRAMPELDPTLEGAANSTLGRMRHDLDTLHGKMIQTAKRRDETLRRQFARTRALAFPDGHAQERLVAFVSFLNQYGPALLARLNDELPLDMGRHWIVSI